MESIDHPHCTNQPFGSRLAPCLQLHDRRGGGPAPPAASPLPLPTAASAGGGPHRLHLQRRGHDKPHPRHRFPFTPNVPFELGSTVSRPRRASGRANPTRRSSTSAVAPPDHGHAGRRSHQQHPPPPPPTRTLRGLSELFPPPPAARPYDALLLDQFGVLHDGSAAYPLAPAAVAAAAAAGVVLLILSNTSRRSAEALAKLPALGFDGAPWAAAITSGELAHAELVGHPDRYRGTRVLHANWVGRGGVALGAAGLVPVGTDAAAAELLLTHGTEGVTASGSDGTDVVPVPYEQLTALVTSVARRRRRPAGGGGPPPPHPSSPSSLPPPPPVLLCANPDLVTVDGAALRPMPGALAAAYEAAGGPVVRLGKPAAPPYAAALAVLAAEYGVTDASRVLAVGDSVGHDVAGAIGAGLDSVFVAGGIDAARFGLAHDDAGDNAVGRGGGGGRPPGRSTRRRSTRCVWRRGSAAGGRRTPCRFFGGDAPPRGGRRGDAPWQWRLSGGACVGGWEGAAAAPPGVGWPWGGCGGVGGASRGGGAGATSAGCALWCAPPSCRRAYCCSVTEAAVEQWWQLVSC
ncbi:hypothetical protein BU14_0033s0065 [Porphyra umbilicalis]|uniref:Uncharacterized protein n=1 Tax=Porphyra umbilicalis TaxID=2786 RepID=A0A1X6PIM2_PORUM|nr:hypothetical protein BU14_0033s0065 [Porphyra umbilicalis]|eukprot:OSX80721.1 hypothetical protein BU14_0033s0065 [Porphyra umbilicalis]